jgi:hypothetical protein
VHTHIQRIQFGEDLVRRPGPGEWFGVGVVLGDVARIATCRSTIEWKLPRLSRRRVSAEKNVSTAFSQEPEVGVK